jgi:hypothetical protein
MAHLTIMPRLPLLRYLLHLPLPAVAAETVAVVVHPTAVELAPVELAPVVQAPPASKL